jgi:hypothetical protein
VCIYIICTFSGRLQSTYDRYTGKYRGLEYLSLDADVRYVNLHESVRGSSDKWEIVFEVVYLLSALPLRFNHSNTSSYYRQTNQGYHSDRVSEQ